MAFCCSIADIDICTALSDVEEQASIMGTPITYIYRKEGNVARDSLGTIKQRSLETPYQFNALPVERYPDYKKLERAGLREGVEAIVYLPMATFFEYGLIRQDVNKLGSDFSALETVRSTVVLDGSEWKIADKGLFGRLSWVPLYVTLGLRIA
jgi:hypothetical protein